MDLGTPLPLEASLLVYEHIGNQNGWKIFITEDAGESLMKIN